MFTFSYFALALAVSLYTFRCSIGRRFFWVWESGATGRERFGLKIEGHTATFPRDRSIEAVQAAVSVSGVLLMNGGR